ncbi:hypothetical protein BJX96DRAFT_187394 [Aspergillus floccosus]
MSSLNMAHVESLHKASSNQITALLQKGTTRYTTTKNSTKEEQPNIPDPSLFQTLSPTGEDAKALGGFPTTGQCAVHLELLEVFYMLRNRIIYSRDLDTAFGVEPNKRTVYRRIRRGERKQPVELRDPTWDARRNEKWPYYLELAAGRFHSWIRVVDGVWQEEKLDSTSIELSDGMDFMPPVDVLMVWHAFLLNPLDFEQYCKTNGLLTARNIPFPWKRIHKAIDSQTWKYSLHDTTADWLLETCKMEPDLFKYLEKVGQSRSPAHAVLSRYGTGRRKAGLSKYAVSDSPVDTRELDFIKAVKSATAQSRDTTPLVENVKRQASFVDKMHAQLWICSPAAAGTTRRAVDRYGKFVQLFKLYPDTILVPTLDVDLVWHTHQCSAALYQEYMIAHTGRFIRHDDRFGQNVLDTGFDTTQEVFFASFGERYHLCLCWNCEAIADGLEEAEKDGRQVDIRALAEEIGEEVSYYAAVEIAKRKRQDLPVRD